MRLLLDTHIALWAVTEPERIKLHARDWIIDPDNDVAVSIVALWEIALKRSVRPNHHDTPVLSPKETMLAFGGADFELLPIRIDDLELFEKLPFHNSDPFDRLLVATAMANQFRLLTQDKALVAYGDHVMLV